MNKTVFLVVMFVHWHSLLGKVKSRTTSSFPCLCLTLFPSPCGRWCAPTDPTLNSEAGRPHAQAPVPQAVCSSTPQPPHVLYWSRLWFSPRSSQPVAQRQLFALYPPLDIEKNIPAPFSLTIPSKKLVALNCSVPVVWFILLCFHDCNYIIDF